MKLNLAQSMHRGALSLIAFVAAAILVMLVLPGDGEEVSPATPPEQKRRTYLPRVVQHDGDAPGGAKPKTPSPPIVDRHRPADRALRSFHRHEGAHKVRLHEHAPPERALGQPLREEGH